MNSKDKVLVVYDYFFPAFKAGGPVQSLINLSTLLNGLTENKVYTGTKDLNEEKCLRGIERNKWMQVQLPGQAIFTEVFYSNSLSLFQSEMKKTEPSILYLNGLYSFSFFIGPLFLSRGTGSKPKVVICPRGMLQKGALSVKPLKKKVYLKALKLSGLLNDVHWHATNKEEEQDIKRMFGNHVGVTIAPNIPKNPVDVISYPEKEKERLRLVYLSLISEKKNLLSLLEVIKCTVEGVTLDIYGPIKDAKYWERCKLLIKECGGRAVYKGDVQPYDVQNVFSHYDASILLTKGENFGHALYESLSVGRPIITSHFTPWNNMQKRTAGWNVDISNFNEAIATINSIAALAKDDYSEYCKGAYKVASDYYDNLDATEKYKKLFSISG